MGRPASARAVDRAERRVEGWLRVDPAIHGAGFDGDSYKALVDRLVDVVNAVGPVDAVVGLTAFVKVTALVLASTLRLEDDAEVEKLCSGHGAWIANEVMALRKATVLKNRSN